MLALTPAPDPTPPPVPVQPKPSRKRPTAPLPEDWQPAPETIATLINLGFDPAAIEAEAGPFKIYWRERGERRAVWQAGFINWMKNQRKWEQRDAQRTEQQARFTDASGRPISEREATRQARIERLLEPFDGEIDLDMRI